jgi:alpha-N-arabinofuranosidase
MIKRHILLLCCMCMLGTMTKAQPRITIDLAHPGAQISPTMYGVFFEDINFGADGGLYAELVKNRSFEFDRPLDGWRVMKRHAIGDALILRDENRPRNPRYLRIRVDQVGRDIGLVNEGFRGMGIRAQARYRFSVEARRIQGDISALRAEIVSSKGQVLAEGRVQGFSPRWGSYTCEMTAKQTDARATLRVWVEGTGQLDVDMLSLFPLDTWKGRKNGLRADLVRMLADMNPGFLRFPGGCIVEGFDLSQRYQWKNSIGDPNERILNINRWNFEFKHRPAPDYFQSYGLGYYEYFLLAEDLDAEPMPIITCGMACQFNTAELVPMDQLGPYVQDALDLIEFANGPAHSQWGRVRAEMGHAKPFHLKMIGIGNEQWGPQYIERYKVFARAIKAKYPAMQLIAATGSDATIFPNGKAEIEYLWTHWRTLKPEIVDEHFYRRPEWFAENVDWYDAYDRTGPKLFVGEYAAQSVGVASPDNRNTWNSAL